MPRLLVVDNNDSFTFTLVDYFLTLGAKVEVARADVLSLDRALGQPVDGFVLSPGPGRPESAGVSVALARACITARRPLLGVCLGHQAIAVAAGGTVDQRRPVHGKAVEINHDRTGLFETLPSPFKAARYNSLMVTTIPASLQANAWDAAGIQGLRHSVAPVHGVQFHPESVASELGHDLLARFLTICC